MAITDAEHLALINAAITAILEGNAAINYSIGGRSVTKQDLPALFKLRRELKGAVGAETGTDGFTYPDFYPDG